MKGGINGTGGIGPVADRDWTGCLSTEKRGVPPGKFWNLFTGPSDFCGGGCMLLLFHAGKSNEKHAEKIEAGGLCFCYFLPGDDPPERGAGEMRKSRFSFP